MSQEISLKFYEDNYDLINRFYIKPGKKIILGDKSNRTCRFCGKKSPEVTFKKEAHAIPEALGNKSITTNYECDTCNEIFGRGIENDLGNWTKPTRTLYRIRGKNGVPTLKRGGDEAGWRIELNDDEFIINNYENDPVCEIDENNKVVTFTLRRDAYTPVCVLKAFVKIALTLMPDNELGNFQDVMSWVTSTDHGIPFARSSPVIQTRISGPMPNDLIVAFLLRRKAEVQNLPYFFLILGYGNDIFQIMIRSDVYDKSLNDKPVLIVPFPVPSNNSDLHGTPKTTMIDLTGREVVKGETIQIHMKYESAEVEDLKKPEKSR